MEAGRENPTYRVQLGHRIATAVAKFSSKAAASDCAGVSTEQLNKWIAGKVKVPVEALMALSESSGVDFNWLATGKDLEGQTKISTPQNRPQPVEGFTLIPRYAVEASAGNGRIAVDETETERLAFKTEWLRDMGLSPRFCSLITAAGDSMNPTIPDGALLLVDMQPDQKIRSGCLYVVIFNGDLLVKRIMHRMDGTVELISDNPIYPKEVIKASDLPNMQIPGRVVWVGHAI